MIEPTGWQGALLLPPVLGTFALGAAALDSALAARAAGSDTRAALTIPLRAAASLLVQQRRRTLAADTLLWRGAGIALLAAASLASLATPLGRWAVSDLSVGVVWFNAMEIVAWAAVWLAGWGANSAFGLVGGYRFLAQGLAYELPHMFVLTTAAIGAGSLRVADIVAAQQNLWFVVWMPFAFVVFLATVLAMAFSGPFAHPTGNDIAGGAAAELSGVDRLIFLTGRWVLLTSGAAMSVALFLGGGLGPLLPGWLWSAVKTAAVLATLVWAGRRLPTIRMERFEELSWIVLLPLTLAQALVVATVVI
ncbi:NADH-quinone oxidoreductase subunit H [Saccharomonospora xinjiangensis]|uniref:NADH:ubiquinone oxidoreductase subunit 1 (Chain H) n=1 Tax=Saccharomonospora xinjiangensis XJ-54 TaxID=882086 RepID=I0V8P9_9PSEU|nr:NADH-quinone oxidoreductase subunit H [Saccharomonospora xinjiangensis]EID56502.1 NADH:ubiquinone oxidoreductase subunit 1 (chain H) [Saccharomonospora xinjiangensis XJ-54]